MHFHQISRNQTIMRIFFFFFAMFKVLFNFSTHTNLSEMRSFSLWKLYKNELHRKGFAQIMNSKMFCLVTDRVTL